MCKFMCIHVCVCMHISVQEAAAATLYHRYAIPLSCQVPQAHWAPACPLHCSWKQKSCFWLVVKCKLPLQDRFPFLDRPQNPPQEGGQEIEWRRFSVVAKTFDPSCYLVISKKGTPPLFVFPSLLPFPLPLPLCFPHFLWLVSWVQSAHSFVWFQFPTDCSISPAGNVPFPPTDQLFTGDAMNTPALFLNYLMCSQSIFWTWRECLCRVPGRSTLLETKASQQALGWG